MNTYRQRHARRIFLDVLTEPNAEARTKRVATACGDDDDLRRLVETLLNAHEDIGPFLKDPGQPPAGDLPPGGSTTFHGDLLGDFRIIREVDRGGMGVVYEAEQVSLGRRVALNVLPFASFLDRRLLQRFKNEAQTAAQLDHTNIVPVHAVGCERGVHFYAMQYVEGPTLAQVIRELRRLPKGNSGNGNGGESSASRLAHSLTSDQFAAPAQPPGETDPQNGPPDSDSRAAARPKTRSSFGR